MIQIKHRNTGAVLHTVDAETLYGAYLYGANLRSANLYDADLRRADLRGADLRGADLSDANLSGADFRSADLSGAYFDRPENPVSRLVARATRISDGYEALAFLMADKSVYIKGGCRWLSLPAFYEHIETYESGEKQDETRAILDYISVAAQLAKGVK